jgi:hypothetical protein
MVTKVSFVIQDNPNDSYSPFITYEANFIGILGNKHYLYRLAIKGKSYLWTQFIDKNTPRSAAHYNVPIVSGEGMMTLLMFFGPKIRYEEE